MRRSVALALVVPALLLPLAGCSDGRKIPTPPVCLTAPGDWLTALDAAPDQVAIDDNTLISSCLPKDQVPAQQEEVGRTAVEVATQLAAFYKTSGGGQKPLPSVEKAALMAGYLVGALEKGAAETQGIHSTLVNRVEAAATNGLDRAGRQVQAAYDKGREAGLESG
ncbi:MAG: hypothetical protein J0H98_03400 [Solirubrobacterales bacterium]|nr:hypothetical protein [Solirubrobacterales bacterium]